MANPDKKQFTAGKSSAWMGFAEKEPTDRGTIRIRIRWKTVTAFILLLAMAAWLGKSVALYYFFKELRQFDQVSFLDMLAFPANRTAVRIEQGDYQIIEAKKALEREDYRRALGLLRSGLSHSSANTEGRLLLAQMYSGWRPDLAIEVLSDGLDDGQQDIEYVKLLFALLLSRKADDRVLELSEQLLERPLPKNILMICQIARLQSAIMTGRFDIATRLYRQTELARTTDGLLLAAHLYEHIGQPGEATKLLQACLNAQPKGELREIYEKYIRILLETGRMDMAREQALAYVIRNPMDWRPRLLFIEVLGADGQVERREKELESYLLEYREEEEAMIRLARLAAGTGDVQGATRLYDIALEYGFNLGTFTLLLVEAQIFSADYQAAIGLCNELAGESPPWLVGEMSNFTALRSMAYLLSGNQELGTLYLKEFLESRESDSSHLYEIAGKMDSLGLRVQALPVLQKAHSIDPRDASILARLIDVELDLGVTLDIDEHLESLFSLRQPDYSVLSDFHKRLQGDRFLFVNNRGSLLGKLEEALREMERLELNVWEQPRKPVF